MPQRRGRRLGAPARVVDCCSPLATLGALDRRCSPTSTPGARAAARQDVTWISELGIHYKLGVDGINLFLILLTALLWLAATAGSLLRDVGARRASTT